MIACSARYRSRVLVPRHAALLWREMKEKYQQQYKRHDTHSYYNSSSSSIQFLLYNNNNTEPKENENV